MNNKLNELYEMCFNKKLNNLSDLSQYINIKNDTILHCKKCGKIMNQKYINANKIQGRCSFCDTKTTMSNLSRDYDIEKAVDVIYFIYYFSLNCNFDIIQRLTRCTKYAINSFQTFILNKINGYFRNNKYKIGGKDMIVEVDESFLGKRKYNVGRIQNQKIILGGICRSTKQRFMQIIEKRTKNIIGKAIEDNIQDGTIIYTDQWSSYLYYFMNNQKYKHNFVNHKYNFVDPLDGTHTQNIESMWSSFKKFKRRKQYFKQNKLDLYISEYLIRNIYKDDDLGLFIFLIKLVFE
ncbi:hypothetical protein H311_01616 [Anncaliia algerae PRA109]|nr:hypothetical protein H311_01616 [Anncaliia algerae PRA109]